MIRTRGKDREIKINRRTVTSLTGMKKCYLEKTREERWRINKTFLLQWKSLSCVWLFVTPWTMYSPWNSPGQNTRVGSLSLLQGIFSTQGLNPGLPHCKQILYQLSHEGSPRILEWVAYPFSSGSSRPRNPTRVSCIAGGFFTKWAIREKLGGISFNGQLFIDIYVFSLLLVKRRQFLPKSMVIIQSGCIINQWLPK